MIWTHVKEKHSILHVQTSQSSWLTFNSDMLHFSHRSLIEAHSIYLPADLSSDDEHQNLPRSKSKWSKHHSLSNITAVLSLNEVSYRFLGQYNQSKHCSDIQVRDADPSQQLLGHSIATVHGYTWSIQHELLNCQLKRSESRSFIIHLDALSLIARIPKEPWSNPQRTMVPLGIRLISVYK